MVGWGEYLKLGVPTAGIVCAQFWAWDLLGIMSGYLGVEQ